MGGSARFTAVDGFERRENPCSAGIENPIVKRLQFTAEGYEAARTQPPQMLRQGGLAEPHRL